MSALLAQAGIRHELLFVDDGSRDGTWAAVQAQAARMPQVRGVRFSRNFGKEAAIFAATARRSSSLKSEALDMSTPMAPLMAE